MLTASVSIAADRASSTTVIEHVERQLVSLLGVDRAEFRAPGHDQIPILTPDGFLTRAGRTVDVDRVGLPTDSEIRLPARNGRQVLGEFRLVASTDVTRPSREQRRVAVHLVDQAGASLTAEASGEAPRRPDEQRTARPDPE